MGFGRWSVILLVMVGPRPRPRAVRVAVTMAMISPGRRRGRWGRWWTTEEIIIITVVKWKLSISLLNLVDFFF